MREGGHEQMKDDGGGCRHYPKDRKERRALVCM